VNRSFRHSLLLLLLASVCFTLATLLQPRVASWGQRHAADNVMKVLLGDGRRLFANHFFVQADVTFHSGYYPSIFDRDQAPKDSRHMTAHEDAHEEHEHGPSGPGHGTHEDHSDHECEMSFLRPPRDWIEAFGRRFMVTEHTHLTGGKEREMLPWLRVSAELDPQRVETYTVASYWLRNLGKFQEAERFLREGLRNNPKSYEILFELGRLYNENLQDPARARNVWELGVRCWEERESRKEKPDLLALDELAVHLADLEEKAGNLARALEWLQVALRASPRPDAVRARIEGLRQRLAADSPGPSP
jgi:tetratricopeptide (TPR) repeat protein